MKNSVKVLSIILVLAALFGLVGGGMSLKDVLDCKAYWEDKGAKSDADLTTLEDGLNTLKENEQAYLDGRDAYEKGLLDYDAGKKALEDGQEEYDAGLKTLEEKTKEYNDGLNTLRQAEQKLNEGQATYNAGLEAYNAGKAQLAKYEASKAQLELLGKSLTAANAGLNDYNTLTQAMGSAQFQSLAADGIALQQAAATFAATYGVAPTDSAAVAKIVQNSVNPANIQTSVSQMIAQNHSAEIQQIMSDDSCDQATAAQKWMQQNPEKVQQYTDLATYNEVQSLQITQDVNALQALQAQLNSSANCAVMNSAQSTLKSLSSNMNTAAQGFITLAPDQAASFSGLSAMLDKVDAAANAEDPATFLAAAQELQKGVSGSDSPLAKLTPMLAEQQQVYQAGMKELEAATPAYNAGKAQLPAAAKELGAGRAELDAGYNEYYAGREKLEDGKTQLEEGKAKLEEANQTIADGKKALSDAEKQLADGKAKLDEFEAGRDQVIAGIETVKASETYAGLTSIADRLGADYKYLDNNGDLDIDQGLLAVATAREFSSENSALVTKELTSRAVAAVFALIASVLALVAGVMGLTGKAKLAGILAAAAAVAAVVTVILAAVAGFALSAVAGSTIAALAIAAGAVVAVVSAADAVVALKSVKAAA